MSRNHQINNVDKFNDYLKDYILPFCSDLAKERSDYQHIDYAGCGTVGMLSSNIYDCFKANYSGVLSIGFEFSQLEQLELNKEQNEKLITPCLRDNNKYQISAINDEAIEMIGKELGLHENIILKIKELQNSYLMEPEKFKEMLININNNYGVLYKIWNESGLGQLQLTTVGIALAHANIKKAIHIDLDLGIWIK